jgi:hypothetical protein
MTAEARDVVHRQSNPFAALAHRIRPDLWIGTVTAIHERGHPAGRVAVLRAVHGGILRHPDRAGEKTGRGRPAARRTTSA